MLLYPAETPAYIVRQVELTDECIEKIADAVARKIRGEEEIQIERREPVMRWIPCEERLPKPFEHCLWTTTDGRVVYHHCDGLFSNYTAWMPLPEPYKGEE